MQAANGDEKKAGGATTLNLRYIDVMRASWAQKGYVAGSLLVWRIASWPDLEMTATYNVAVCSSNTAAGFDGAQLFTPDQGRIYQAVP